MKIAFNTLWFTLIFFFLLPQAAEAQHKRRRYQQRFKAGLVFGGNLSQIDGDRYNGFDKGNLQFGLSGTAILSENAEIGVEFLYAGRGSKVESDKGSALERKDRLIDLRYMEVPILFRYRHKGEAPSSLIEVGFSFGRIIRSRVTEPETPGDGIAFRDFEPYFNNNEFSLLAGYGYQASRHLNFKMRFGFALTEFYSNPAQKERLSANSIFAAGSNDRIQFMRNYYLALMAQYQF